MQIQPTALDVAWAAGLFEGEGCWNAYTRESGKIQMQARLTMTDRDVVERFARIVQCGHLRNRHSASDKVHGWKPSTDWYVYEAEKIRELIALFLPYMGERRRAKADETLRLGINVQPHNAKKTHCPEGHPLAGENLMLEPFMAKNGKIYTARRCRICRTAQMRDRMRAKLGVTPDRYRIKE